MSEAKLLRVLADKIEDLEAVTLFPADVTDPGTLSITWSAGSDQPGYQTLNEAIGELVKQHWSALRAQVVKQRETEVQQARTTWSAAHPSVAGASAGASVGAPEVALRKVVG